MRQILSNSIVFLLLAGGVYAQTTAEVGSPAPELELRDSSGATHKLSDYRGEKIVILEFFRSGDW